jgi:hypothetical protein
MNKWAWILVGACFVAVFILVGSSLLEARGLVKSPWMGHLSARLEERPWGAPPGVALVEANAYVNALAGLVSHYLVGVLVLFAVPRTVRRLADTLAGGRRSLASHLLAGILLAATLLAIALLTAIFAHLFPVPIVLFFVFFVAALSGVIALQFELGRELLRRAGRSGASPLAALAVGTFLLFSATRVPYLGPLVLAAVWLTGAGLVLTTRFGSGGRWSLEPLQEDVQP